MSIPTNDCGAASPITNNLICGGHGECINNVCLCDAKGWWIGQSDWINVAKIDCSTNLIAMYVLWGLNILVILFVYIKSHSVIIARFESFFEQKKLNKEYSLLNNRGLLAVVFFFVFSMPPQLAYSIIKIVQPQRVVGFDPLITVLFFLAKLGFYLGAAAYQPALLQSILKGTKGVERLLKIYTVLMTLSQVLAAILGAFPFATLATPTFADHVIVMRCYYFIHACNLSWNGLMALYISTRIANVLDKSASLQADNRGATKTLKLKSRLNSVQGTVFKQGVFQGLFFFFVFAYPFMWNKHDYFLPVSWIVMPILGMKSAFAVNLDGYKNKSLIERFMGKKEHSTTAGDGIKSPQSNNESETQPTKKGSIVVIGGSIMPNTSVVMSELMSDAPSAKDRVLQSMPLVNEEPDPDRRSIRGLT